MITRLTTPLALAAALIAVSVTSAAASIPPTPNTCIESNGGDWNPCNVGNSGGGDVPYQAVLDEQAGLLRHWSVT